MSLCPVCGEEGLSLQPCGHALCAVCAAKWLSRKQTCPICRSPTCGFCVSIVSLSAPPGGCTRVLAIGPLHHAGVTLRETVEGLCVIKLTRKDVFYRAGIRVKDLVVEVNGVCVQAAEAAIQILEESKRQGRLIVVKTVSR